MFSGGGFMSSQSTQSTDSGSFTTKVNLSLSLWFSLINLSGFCFFFFGLQSRGELGLLPLTVKQISDAYLSSDDKSNFMIDGVDANIVWFLNSPNLFFGFWYSCNVPQHKIRHGCLDFSPKMQVVWNWVWPISSSFEIWAEMNGFSSTAVKCTLAGFSQICALFIR